ncbi:MAG: methyltransferase domain-containing protein [Planctomycetota bacterium]
MRTTFPESLKARLFSSLACPQCRGPVSSGEGGLACAACSTTYAPKGGTQVLLPPALRQTVESDVAAWNREAIRPKLSYRWIRRLMSPQVHRWGPELRWLRARLSTLPQDALVVDVGCGAAEDEKGVVRLDLSPGPEVDVAGDALSLPFLDSSVDAAVAIRVLEHVKDPVRVVAELFRVLRPGGLVVAVVPFFEPYHRNPTDHSRFCRDGVERLFGAFERVELEVATGPAISLAWFLKEWIAVLAPFSNRPLVYASIREVAGWLFAPIAWLDPLVRRKEYAHKIAGSFWYVGRKPATPPA